MSKPRDPNCLLCHIRVLSIIWSLVLGISTMECPHHEPVLKPRHSSSRKHILLSLMALIVVLCETLQEIIKIRDTGIQANMIVYHLLNCLNNFQVLFISIAFYKDNWYFNKFFIFGFVCLCYKRRLFGIEAKISNRFKFVLKKMEQFTLLVISGSVMMLLVRIIYSNRSLSDIITALSQTIVAIYVNVFFSIFYYGTAVYEDAFQGFIKEVNNIINRGNKSSFTIDFSKKIEFMRRYYLCITQLFSYCCKPYNVIIIMAAFIVVIVISIQLAIYLTTGLNLLNVMIDGPIFVELFFLFIFVNVICLKATQFYRLGDDIVSKLYRIPTSKLTISEAQEIEWLISILQTKRPYLQVADLVTIRSGFFSSILSTVVTYVLMTLQFMQMFHWESNPESI